MQKILKTSRLISRIKDISLFPTTRVSSKIFFANIKFFLNVRPILRTLRHLIPNGQPPEFSLNNYFTAQVFVSVHIKVVKQN